MDRTNYIKHYGCQMGGKITHTNYEEAAASREVLMMVTDGGGDKAGGTGTTAEHLGHLRCSRQPLLFQV